MLPSWLLDGSLIMCSAYNFPRAGYIATWLKQQPKKMMLLPLALQVVSNSISVFHWMANGSMFCLTNWLNNIPTRYRLEWILRPEVMSSSYTLQTVPPWSKKDLLPKRLENGVKGRSILDLTFPGFSRSSNLLPELIRDFYPPFLSAPLR